MADPEPLRIRISLRPSAVTEPLADEREVLDMIKGRPEDEDFIYLDVDGEDEPADAAWSPKARVVVGKPGEGASTRPKRNKRRKVVDSCLASASAKLSSQESSLDEEDENDDQHGDIATTTITSTTTTTTVDGVKKGQASRSREPGETRSHPHPRDGAGDDRRRRRRNGGTSAATRTRTRKQVQQERKKELKKGHRTPKQRLAQAIGLWKGVRS